MNVRFLQWRLKSTQKLLLEILRPNSGPQAFPNFYISKFCVVLKFVITFFTFLHSTGRTTSFPGIPVNSVTSQRLLFPQIFCGSQISPLKKCECTVWMCMHLLYLNKQIYETSEWWHLDLMLKTEAVNKTYCIYQEHKKWVEKEKVMTKTRKSVRHMRQLKQYSCSPLMSPQSGRQDKVENPWGVILVAGRLVR